MTLKLFAISNLAIPRPMSPMERMPHVASDVGDAMACVVECRRGRFAVKTGQEDIDG